ncbi:alanine racemase [Kiritimatiella glycovorans]|uniref:Alanine racemase n=1 Tax=Kiritimatiella glycovorans TaxID=1307763 RepID=A0A0G3EK35_9BACT|nr:alanine racemase [Kiritimatiella glycovorans]AKJ64504.1 Alanine racemase [Kiritimatiella glycovorans]
MMTTGEMKHAWVEIDLERVRRNVRAVKDSLGPETGPMFVVKADAYGHGMIPCARAAAEAGVRWFAVAYPEEAFPLRRALPEAEILVLGVAMEDEVEPLARERITPIIANREHARLLASVAAAKGVQLNAHLKVDTGMSRLGVLWSELDPLLEELAESDALRLTGICSHFAAVEPRDLSEAERQAGRYREAVERVERMTGTRVFRHLSSSRAAKYCRQWDYDAVRPGIALYGYGARDTEGRFQTEPILQWKCRVLQVKRLPAGSKVGYYGTWTLPRDTWLATLSAGYADGYHRALSNRGDVLIRGRRRRIVGRISMNWILVDAGPERDVDVGDEAVLIGEQGGAAVWADELARLCRTIPYEILTGIHPALRRVYR